MEPLSIIVAVDKFGGFGKDGKIPWNFKEDMKHFKDVTSSNICIMGRKTYEDMLDMVIRRRKQNVSDANKKAIAEYESNQPDADRVSITDIDEILPNRTSFVITSDPNYNAVGATVKPSLREATQSLDVNDSREIFVIGGRRMFIEALTWTHYVYMTIIKKDYNCDVYFPMNSLTKKFKIVDGTETDDMYFVKYKRFAR